jgi:paraquat-inducible protein B
MVEGISQLVNSSDLQESIRTLNKTMNGLQRIVNNSEQHLLPAVSDIALTAREAQKVMKNLNVLVQNVQTLASNAESLVRESHGLIKNTSGLVTNTNKFVTNIDGEMDRLVRSFIKTSESAGATLKQTEKTLTAVESIASEDSPMRYELLTTLSELSDAARSIRLMAEYLERHPDALIYGKSGMRGGRR